MRPTDPRSPRGPGVEEGDERIPIILGFGFWLFVAVTVACAGLYGLFRLFAAEARDAQPALPPNVAASLQRTPAAPRLEPLPLAPRLALRASEDERLSTYGWTERASGAARIPIDVAMKMIVERGVPGGKPFPAPPQPAASATPAAGAGAGGPVPKAPRP